MITLSKSQTALVQAYIHQQDNEVSRFMFAAPFISNTDYNNLMDMLDEWIIESNEGQLIGTNDNNTTFTFGGIDRDTSRPKR